MLRPKKLKFKKKKLYIILANLWQWQLVVLAKLKIANLEF